MTPSLSQCLIPATACVAGFLTFCLAIRAVAVRHYLRIVPLLLGSLIFTSIFWRVMGGSGLAVDMLTVTYGAAAILVYWLRRPATSRFLIPTAVIGLWIVWATGLNLLMPFRMTEGVAQQLVSPDGRYRAALSYLDGLTYGYYHVLLERTALHGLLAPDEVTEVCSEGLDHIAWRDARTLVVHYSCPEDQFVVRDRNWAGVRIIYERE